QSTIHPDVTSLFFVNAAATIAIYTLSLHDALPICRWDPAGVQQDRPPGIPGQPFPLRRGNVLPGRAEAPSGEDPLLVPPRSASTAALLATSARADRGERRRLGGGGSGGAGAPLLLRAQPPDERRPAGAFPFR